MRTKSILTEAKQIDRAVTLIHLGARLQVLESETDLSYERLLRLYKEVSGKSPSKGQLPFSTDWFMTWQPNIHASLFLNMHEYLNKVAEMDEIDAVIKAYQLYSEQTQAQGLEPLLSVTRAWRLVKFIDNGMLTMTKCSKCGGHFVTPPARDRAPLHCGLCNPPARAGKGKAAGSIQIPAGDIDALDAAQIALRVLRPRGGAMAAGRAHTAALPLRVRAPGRHVVARLEWIRPRPSVPTTRKHGACGSEGGAGAARRQLAREPRVRSRIARPTHAVLKCRDGRLLWLYRMQPKRRDVLRRICASHRAGIRYN